MCVVQPVSRFDLGMNFWCYCDIWLLKRWRFVFCFLHYDFMHNFRLGTKTGFQNIVKAQCHCVGTAAMNEAAASLHENVLGYDESHLQKHLDHKFTMGVSLDLLNWIFVVWDAFKWFRWSFVFSWCHILALPCLQSCWGCIHNRLGAQRRGHANTGSPGIPTGALGNPSLEFHWILLGYDY